jgi:DNA-binding transcriptional regulator YdaS (Cro superfamily)
MTEAWLDALAREIVAVGQHRAARRIGYSQSVVCQVMKGSYPGDLTAVRKAVEGGLLSATVACPVLGDVPSHRCLAIQRLPFSATTPERVRLWRICRAGCPHSRLAASPRRENGENADAF